MKDAIIISQGGYEDTGLTDFIFIFDGKKYKVTAKNGRYDVLDGFYKYIKYVSSGKHNPFTYSKKHLLDIRNMNAPKSKEPETEQMSLFSSELDMVSNSLENKGFIKESYQLDIISNTIESCWNCNHVNLFKDELDNFNIDSETAKKVLDLAEKYDLIKTSADQKHWLGSPSSYTELREQHNMTMLRNHVEDTIDLLNININRIPKDLYDKSISILREVQQHIK